MTREAQARTYCATSASGSLDEHGLSVDWPMAWLMFGLMAWLSVGGMDWPMADVWVMAWIGLWHGYRLIGLWHGSSSHILRCVCIGFVGRAWLIG